MQHHLIQPPLQTSSQVSSFSFPSGLSDFVSSKNLLAEQSSYQCTSQRRLMRFLTAELIHRSQLRHNMIRWLAAYLHGRKATWLYRPPLGFSSVILVETYKAIVLFYAALIWFTIMSSSQLDKLEVNQSKALEDTDPLLPKAAVSHLRAETGVLPMGPALEMSSQQFYASVL